MIQDHLKNIASSRDKEGEAPVEFLSTAEEHYHQFFISAEILHWNSPGNKNNGFKNVAWRRFFSWTFAMSSVFSNDLDKFTDSNKSLKNIVDEKQVGINYFIMNASRKLLVPEVLNLSELILLVPTTNAVSERSRSTLCRV